MNFRLTGGASMFSRISFVTAGTFDIELITKDAMYLLDPRTFRTMALVCACLGLRISECLALRWSDVDWLNGTLCVERGIVHQVVDDVKTPESQRFMCIDREMADVFQRWRQRTQFSAPEDWMFASPYQI